MAITPRGIKDSNMINHEAAYYRAMIKHFSPFKNHRMVAVMDSLLKANLYYEIKMDAYSVFFKGDKLERKAEYDRINWGGENTILPYLTLIEDFAKKSKFTAFYKKNKPYYDGMIRAYRDSLGVPQMQEWLKNNFPKEGSNCYKIIFSPLVNGDQSASGFESNGFKEAQQHVDFPEYWFSSNMPKLSPKGVNIDRGSIIFTEINHSFENSGFEEKKVREQIMGFKLNKTAFTDPKKPAHSYNFPIGTIQEYMNWGLVSLRNLDFAPKDDIETLIQYRENWMTNYRGFSQFKAFNRFLIKAYQERKQGQTVADLYPQIIEWFRVHNK